MSRMPGRGVGPRLAAMVSSCERRVSAKGLSYGHSQGQGKERLIFKDEVIANPDLYNGWVKPFPSYRDKPVFGREWPKPIGVGERNDEREPGSGQLRRP